MKKLIAMALFLVILLASCAADGDTPPVKDMTTTPDGSSTAEVTTQPTFTFPSKDYGSYEFKILEYTKTDTGARQFLDFGWSAESAGDLINDAVYQRNMIVEDRFNVTIRAIENDNAANAGKTSVLAGTDEYDIVMAYMILK